MFNFPVRVAFFRSDFLQNPCFKYIEEVSVAGKVEQTLVMYATSLSNLQKALQLHTRYSQVSISKQAKLSKQGRIFLKKS